MNMREMQPQLTERQGAILENEYAAAHVAAIRLSLLSEDAVIFPVVKYVVQPESILWWYESIWPAPRKPVNLSIGSGLNVSRPDQQIKSISRIIVVKDRCIDHRALVINASIALGPDGHITAESVEIVAPGDDPRQRQNFATSRMSASDLHPEFAVRFARGLLDGSISAASYPALVEGLMARL